MAYPPAPGFESPAVPVSPDINTVPPVSPCEGHVAPAPYDAPLVIPLPDHGLPGYGIYGMEGWKEEQQTQGEEDIVMALVRQHATGECMPSGEGYLQNYLNSAMQTTYTLKSLESICTVDSALASSIIHLELSSNFTNALGHVREARELFPDDELFRQEDIWVLQHLKNNWGSEDGDKKKKRFAFLPSLPSLPSLPFGKKDKEAKARTKRANEAFEGEPDEVEKKKTIFARLRRSPNKDKCPDASGDGDEGGECDEETKEERKEKEKREKKEKADRKKQEKQEKKKTKKRSGSLVDDATPHAEEVAAS